MKRERLEIAALIGIGLALLIPIGLVGYLGSYNRYFADDFCYVVWGYDRNLITYMSEIHTTLQARFSSNFLLYFIQFADPRNTPLLPFLLLIGMALGSALPIYALMQLLHVRHAALVAVVLGELALVVALQVLLDRGEALRHAYFWRSGMTVYVPPKILFGVTLAAIYGASRLRWSGVREVLLALGIGVLALISGGSSETYAAMMVGLFAALIALAWWVLEARDRRYVLPLLVVGMIGSAAVLVITALVPRTVERVLWGAPSLPALVFTSVYEAVWVADQSVKLSPFSMLTALVLPAIAVKRLRGAGVSEITEAQRWRLVFGIPMVVGIAMVCSMAPGVYAQGAPPERALTFATHLLTFGMVVWGAVALPSIQLGFTQVGQGSALPLRYHSIGQAFVVIVLVAMMVGRDINDTPELLVSAREFSEAWDAQAADIHARIERGDPLEGLTGIGISENPNGSASRCAAIFFKSEHAPTP